MFVDPSFYDYILPGYRAICAELGAEYAELRNGLTSVTIPGSVTRRSEMGKKEIPK